MKGYGHEGESVRAAQHACSHARTAVAVQDRGDLSEGVWQWGIIFESFPPEPWNRDRPRIYVRKGGAALGAVSPGKPRHFSQRHPAPTLGSH
jgi:hypothetical protein